MSHRWLVESGDDVLIFIHMLPNSSKKSTFGVDKWRDRLKVSVLSQPISGQANMELVELISSWASVKKKNVVIEKG
ncbi:MAG: YggU family protein, partial [Euryarchaeota archaeon]|nr:YggU family protein [Euryarchaeota archaeon]MBT7322176.1 YggU family protein [Euryarchaeota archaeon]MBT7820609.1 YggU family protein [Euryarchaeota archaeon]